MPTKPAKVSLPSADLPDVIDDMPMAAPLRCAPTLALKPDAPVNEWHHNFDLTTVAGKSALLNASNVADWIPADGETYNMDAVHYLCYPDEYTDRNTGEIVQCTACVFVGSDGKTAKFRNEWSLRRLNAAIAMFGPDDWARGIRIQLYTQQSREPGKRYGSFRVLGLADTKPKG